MKASEVRPKDWLQDESYPIRILYDNDEEDYSIIWGKYKNHKALGVRWRGEINRGYPGQGIYPTWYVEPDFIAITILYRILTLAIDEDNIEYLENIQFAISELTDKMMAKKNLK
jgi:hypothetical protein